MGHKKLKEYYNIKHYVQVTDVGICIGSSYVSDLIVIGLDGKILKSAKGRSNNELLRYMEEMESDLGKLEEVVREPDAFDRSITVYTYSDDRIIEEQCEEVGWPHVTHSGRMMYENTYSTDKAEVVRWAKEDCQLSIKWRSERLEEMEADILKMREELRGIRGNLEQLEADYPDGLLKNEPTREREQ